MRTIGLTLLVADKVLGASNDTSILNTADRLGNADTREHRVGSETLPVAAALRGTAQRTSDRAQLDSHTLALVLLAHGKTAGIEQTAVKRGSRGLARREDRVEVCVADTDGRVLHTHAGEAEARHSADLANTLFTFPAERVSQVNLIVRKWEGTYPTPVVRLTFSMRVICETNCLAWM